MAGFGDGSYSLGSYGIGGYEDAATDDAATDDASASDAAVSVQTFFEAPVDVASSDDVGSCTFVSAIQQTVSDSLSISDAAATVGGWSIVSG